MQLKERDGIACDLCGTTYKTEFTYFSWDFRQVQVNENIRPPVEQIFNMHIVFSLDVCTACWERFKPKIIKHYSAVMSSTRRMPIGIICELSGKKMVGTFMYYHIAVTKVSVSMKGQANVCVRCQTKSHDDKPCTKCGGKDFIRPARIATDKRFVELNASEETFAELRTTAENIRKTAGQWATSTE
jgi:hypothetical protein